MNTKHILIILLILVTVYLSGCGGGIVTPNSYGVGGDFYICENILRGFYIALSNQNYPQALSYCKTGGITFEYVNNVWNIDQQYPTAYTTFQVYNVYNFSYLGPSKIRCNYDDSFTTYSIYGGATSPIYHYGSTMLFEKINGEWKLA